MGKKWILSLITVALVLSISPAFAQADTEMVLAVQVRLTEEGFDPGPKDGILGPQTVQALRLYQREQQLDVTGRIDDDTLRELGLKEQGLWGKVKGVAETSAEKVASAATTAAKATKKGTVTAAKATKKGTVTAAKATSKGAQTAAKATASGTTTAAKATKNTVVKGSRKAADMASGAKDAVMGSDRDQSVLVARVRTKLDEHPRIDASQLEVTSEGDGVIRLTFKNEDTRQWNLAVAQARQVSGVKEVFVRLPGNTSRH